MLKLIVPSLKLGEEILLLRSLLLLLIKNLFLLEKCPVSLIVLLLGYDDLSDFFVEVDTIDSLQFAIQASFGNLRADIVRTADARENLQGEKQEQTELRALQEIEKRQQESKEAEKQRLLKVTRGEEANYRQHADARKSRAAAIRSELFLLQGSPAIPFEEALRHAEFASTQTGVRAAFILGIIAQESELGRNIGQCNLSDDPPKYKWQSVMKPSRDHAPYLQVTQELGLDPNAMPVSCPMRDSSGSQVGWGGAMGPAQFIPSTWVLYKDAVSRITGNNPANPWTHATRLLLLVYCFAIMALWAGEARSLKPPQNILLVETGIPISAARTQIKCSRKWTNTKNKLLF